MERRKKDHNVFLKMALQNYYEAADALGLQEGLTQFLAHSERRLSVSVPVTMDDSSVEIFRGYRVAHNTALGPAKGGIRFHTQVDLDECEALAMMMTWKCSLAGIPYGGGKGGIAVVPEQLSLTELERLCRSFAMRIEPFIGEWTDIPAPDVNTGGREMIWFMDQVSKMRNRTSPATFTGKMPFLFGSKGRRTATGYGLGTCVLACMENLDVPIEGIRVAIQGFGNVGSYAAEFMSRHGAKVIAVGNSRNTWYSDAGLDVEDLLKYTSNAPRGKLHGYEAPGVEVRDVDDVLYTDCDVLIPAALENCINEKNASRINARYIFEGSNGPVTPEADETLSGKGIVVVPDILANSGGVIGSYFEWAQNLSGLTWEDEDYENKLVELIRKNFKRVWNYARERELPMRQASFLFAVERVARAQQARGLGL
ncbi:MAG: Glu/Leu/Phe/Val dehydrogenase [Synergistaceae bacterium]|nr:Glu/Leu/Phe/Val dehydrogenase [Synergistaceae bacterium]